METLIIILIVVMIAQSCIFAYGNFIDLSRQRESANNQQILADSMQNFMVEKEAFKATLNMKDETIRQWIERANELDRNLQEALLVNGLLKNRTAHIEGLKDSFNHQAENEWGGIEAEAEFFGKSQRRCFVEGMKAGAEWISKAVGIKVEFEIDDRFKEDDE